MVLLFVAVCDVGERELIRRVSIFVVVGVRRCDFIFLERLLGLQRVIHAAFHTQVYPVIGARAENTTPHAVNEVGSRDSHEL